MKPKTYTLDGFRWIRRRALESELEAWRAFARKRGNVPMVKTAAEIFAGYLTRMSLTPVNIDGVIYIASAYWDLPDQMWFRHTVGRGPFVGDPSLENWRKRALMIFELTHQKPVDEPIAHRQWKPAKKFDP